MEALKSLNKESIILLNKHDCLNKLITSILIEEAIDSVNLTDDQTTKALEDIKEANGINKDLKIEDWINEQNVSKEEFLKEVLKNHKLNAYCIDKFKHKTEAKFLSTKDSLDTVVYSLIRVKDLFLAKELYQRIIEGETEFADIAAQYSEGWEKSTRGIVGPVALDKAMGPLKELLKSSSPGELRQPIRLDQWYVLVRLESINHAKLDQRMINQLSKILFNEWINTKVINEIEKLVKTLPTKEDILV